MLYSELCKIKGKTDEKFIEQSYFNLMKDEKQKLKDRFIKLAKNYNDFENVMSNIETEMKSRYNVETESNPKF